MSSTENPRDEPPIIALQDLTYKFANHALGLRNVTLNLPRGSRTLLIGANGAGKTTLLRLLAGKALAPANTINIAGTDPFKSTPEGITYLGLEWVLNPVVRRDIGVCELFASVGGDHFPERRDELVAVLDIDLDWRMHAVSDGERRRVQLALGLVRPWNVLLLDEITVDLDLLSRSRFLAWLKCESETRCATIVYATHILDRLEGWPTHLVHMSLGRCRRWGSMCDFENDLGTEAGNSRLGSLVLTWLEEDLQERGPRNGGENSEGQSYAQNGIGGYGLEKRPSR